MLLSRDNPLRYTLELVSTTAVKVYSIRRLVVTAMTKPDCQPEFLALAAESAAENMVTLEIFCTAAKAALLVMLYYALHFLLLSIRQVQILDIFLLFSWLRCLFLKQTSLSQGLYRH